MTLENLLYFGAGSGVGSVVGFTLAMFLQSRPCTTRDGTTAIRVSLSSSWRRMFFALMGLLTVASVGISASRSQDLNRVTEMQQQQMSRQTDCNRGVIRAINTNVDIAADERANLDRLLGTVGQLVLTPDQDRDERAAQLQAAFRAFSEQKAINEAARQPYPPPDCGE